MSRRFLPRAFSSAVSSYVLGTAEIVYDETIGTVRLGDSVTPGGNELSRSDQTNAIFTRTDASGVAVTGAVAAPAYIRLSQRRNLIDFIDKSFWAGMRGSTAPAVAPTNSLGQNSIAAALADMEGSHERRLDLPAAWITQDVANPTIQIDGPYFDIRGAGPENTILTTLSPTADQVALGGTYVRLEGVQFGSQVTRTAGSCINVPTAGSRVVINDITSHAAWTTLNLDGVATQIEYDISNLRAYEPVAGADAIIVNGGYLVLMERILVAGYGQRCASGIKVGATGDLRINNSQIIMTDYPIKCAPVTGSGVASLKIDNTYCGTSTFGSLFTTENGGDIVSMGAHDVWFSETDGESANGFTARGGDGGFFAGLVMSDCQHMLCSGDGMNINGVAGVQIANASCDGNTGSGASIADCANPIVNLRSGAERFGGNQYGLYDNNNTRPCFSGNVTGNTTNLASSSTLGNYAGLISS